MEPMTPPEPMEAPAPPSAPANLKLDPAQMQKLFPGAKEGDQGESTIEWTMGADGLSINSIEGEPLGAPEPMAEPEGEPLDPKADMLAGLMANREANPPVNKYAR